MIQLGGRPVIGFGLGDESAPTSCLPSGNAALRLMRGEAGAWCSVGTTMLLRGALVTTGLAIAGFRGAQLLKGAAGATLAIEAGVLAWAYKTSKEEQT